MTAPEQDGPPLLSRRWDGTVQIWVSRTVRDPDDGEMTFDTDNPDLTVTREQMNDLVCQWLAGPPGPPGPAGPMGMMGPAGGLR